MNNNHIEDELDAIRIEFYEITKNMTPSEKIAYIKEQTTPIHEQFGIQPVLRAETDVKKRATV